MLLSIVIPAFNAETCLGQCLGSCLRQGTVPGGYEVVVVDDGSTDGTAALALSFAERSREAGGPHVEVVRRPNGGLSAARNTGLSHAEGEYVWFVDADDWIAPDCLSTLLQEVSGHDILAFGGADRIPAGDGTLSEGPVFRYPQDVVRTGPEHIAAMSERLKMCVPFHIFRRGFLEENALRFREGLLHEDVEFTPRAMYRAASVRVSVEVPYFRLVRPGSLSRTVNPRRITDLISVVSILREFMETEPVAEAVRPPFCSIISNIANQAMKLSASWKTGEEEIAAAEGLPEVFRGAAERKYRLEGALLKRFPRRPAGVYSALARLRSLFSRTP